MSLVGSNGEMMRFSNDSCCLRLCGHCEEEVGVYCAACGDGGRPGWASEGIAKGLQRGQCSQAEPLLGEVGAARAKG